jgi:hypothetical protein
MPYSPLVAGPSPIKGAFTGTGQSAWFSPAVGRSFNACLDGSFVGTVRLERAFPDRIGTVHPLTAAGASILSFTAPCSEQWQEDEFGVLYRWNCTAYTSGTINYRLSQ